MLDFCCWSSAVSGMISPCIDAFLCVYNDPVTGGVVRDSDNEGGYDSEH